MPWKRKPIRAYTTYSKDFTAVMKPSERGIEGVERIFSEDIFACNVTEIEECVEGLDDITGYITFECGEKDLAGLSIWVGTIKVVRTFINAFESLPVHCLKFRPCLNLRRPGKRGASAML